MTRPTHVTIDSMALLHNLNRVRECAPNQAILAMVKGDAYGCGTQNVIPVLDGQVTAFGVASLPEAMVIRELGARAPCMLAQGVFTPDEWHIVSVMGFQCVIHHRAQLEWLLAAPLTNPVTIWIKVNTGMNRLGFSLSEVDEVLSAVRACAWVSPDLYLMTHFACADQPDHPSNELQRQRFNSLAFPGIELIRSMANSAAILSNPASHADVVRPGIMLYGISPFEGRTGAELGLLPVMQFKSAIMAIHHYPAGAAIGYSETWISPGPCVIAVVPVGYADGFPRHIKSGTRIWVNGHLAPIVGRVSMDMITVDITHCVGLKVGDPVELWGQHIPVETIAASADTIGYELLTKVTRRGRGVDGFNA